MDGLYVCLVFGAFSCYGPCFSHGEHFLVAKDGRLWKAVSM
jgi:hypothetical protein